MWNILWHISDRRASIANMQPDDPMWWPTMIRQTFNEMNDARDEISDIRVGIVGTIIPKLYIHANFCCKIIHAVLL